jgi:hypothetical protein
MWCYDKVPSATHRVTDCDPVFQLTITGYVPHQFLACQLPTESLTDSRVGSQIFCTYLHTTGSRGTNVLEGGFSSSVRGMVAVFYLLMLLIPTRLKQSTIIMYSKSDSQNTLQHCGAPNLKRRLLISYLLLQLLLHMYPISPIPRNVCRRILIYVMMQTRGYFINNLLWLACLLCQDRMQ